MAWPGGREGRGREPREEDGLDVPPAGTWYVYILRCADGTLYTGVTTDLARRLRQHNAGTAARYTRCRRPVALVYHEAHAGRGPALRRERALKALSRRQKLALVRQARRATRTG